MEEWGDGVTRRGESASFPVLGKARGSCGVLWNRITLLINSFYWKHVSSQRKRTEAQSLPPEPDGEIREEENGRRRDKETEKALIKLNVLRQQNRDVLI